MKLIFLGTGANGGTPQLDCACPNCRKARAQPKFQRLRSSVAIKEGRKWIIIDCGPDFRTQLLRANLSLANIKAIVLTHLHADHLAGLTELSCGKPHRLKIVTPKPLQKEILSRPSFNFLFRRGFAEFREDRQIKFFEVEHWKNHRCYGVQAGKKDKICYIPDINKINPGLLVTISQSRLVVFDGTFFRLTAHGHLPVAQSAPVLSQSGKKVVFTHINHSENPKILKSFLKKFNFTLAEDQMEIRI